MTLTPEPPSNIVAIDPESAKDLEILLKQQKKEWPCAGRHKKIIVDPKNRTVACDACGFAVDAFDYLLSWANEGERKMEGLKQLSIRARITGAELADLTRKVKNARATLKRAGKPQPEVERQAWDRWRDNPENPEFAVVSTKCQSSAPLE